MDDPGRVPARNDAATGEPDGYQMTRRSGAIAEAQPRPAPHPALARSLPIALLRARERVTGPLREVLAGAGVTEQQWRVLNVLEENGPLQMSVIGEMTCLQMSSLSRIVETLVAKGMVERLRDPVDRRRQHISLTENGSDLIRANIAASRRISNAVAEGLGPEKHQRLLDLLEELNRIEL